MDQPKKRQYRSIKRAQQARETRVQIILAARKQFIQSGYEATIDDIAREAGVAVETVYAVFGSKRNILAAVVNYSVGGDDLPISVPERPEPKRLMQESNPVIQIKLFSEDITKRLERAAPVYEVMKSPAKTEPELADLLRAMQDLRYRNIRSFIQNLIVHSPLRDGLDEATATETTWGITSPELFLLFTRDRGWRLEKWSQWLGATLICLLLPTNFQVT